METLFKDGSAVQRRAGRRSRLWALLHCFLISGCASPTPEPTSDATTSSEGTLLGHDAAVPLILVGPEDPTALQDLLADLDGPARIQLQPGTYHLDARAVDKAIGERDEATAGLVVTGWGITIFGVSRDSVTLVTKGASGVLFHDCEACVLRGVTIRPEASVTGHTTIRALRSQVTLQQCHLGAPFEEPVLSQESVSSRGPIGVLASDASRVALRSCNFGPSFFTAVAVVGDAEVEMRGGEIHGPWSPSSGVRTGPAVIVQEAAKLFFEENLIHGFTTGIQASGDVEVEIRENVIEEIATSGLSLWSPPTGSNGVGLRAFIEDNVFFRTGACGVHLEVSKAPEGEAGYLSKNVFVETASLSADAPSACRPIPIDLARTPAGFSVANNFFHANQDPGPFADQELTLENFLVATMNLYTFHIEPQEATSRSAFMEAFADQYGPPFR